MSTHRLLPENDEWLREGLGSWVYKINRTTNSEYERREAFSERIIEVWKKKSEMLDLSRGEAQVALTELPEELQEFTFLRGLDASDNSLTALPSIEKLKNMGLLRLVKNRLPLEAVLPLTQLSRKCEIYLHGNKRLSREDFAEISRAVEQVRKADPKKGPTFYPLTV